MFSTRWFRKLSLLVVVLIVLSACGGSDTDSPADAAPDDDNPQTTTTSDGDSGGEGGTGSEADLEEAATEMFLAYTSADHQSYFDLLSKSCREHLGYSPVDNHLQGRRFRADGAGVDLSSLGVSSVEISDFTGDSASVVLVLSGTDETFEESVPNTWVYEEGGWHKDECSRITEAQGGLEGYGTDRDEPVPYGGVADINGWLITIPWIAPDDEVTIVELGGEPAADGSQLFNISISPYYNGAKASTTLGEDVAFAMVNGTTIYGDEAECGSDDPAFLDMGAQAGPGDDLGRPYMCRQVSPEHADGMLLRVTDLSSGTDYWFDLTQP